MIGKIVEDDILAEAYLLGEAEDTVTGEGFDILQTPNGSPIVCYKDKFVLFEMSALIDAAKELVDNEVEK